MAGLTKIFIDRITTPGSYLDGDGLELLARPTRAGLSKTWRFRYTFGGKERRMTFGGYPEIGIAAARELRLQCRKQLAAGIDPLEAKARTKETPTYQEASEAYARSFEKKWKHGSSQYLAHQRIHVWPRLGKLSVDRITRQDVVDTIGPHWHTHSRMAEVSLSCIRQVLDFARTSGWIAENAMNPAVWRGNLQYVLPPRVAHKSERHMSSLPWQRIPEFLAALHAAAATPRKTSGKGSGGGALGMRALTAATIELQILTAARTAMTLEATWDEFDLDNRIWTLAGERMKGERPFRIPLSERACEIIKAQTSTGRYVFAQTLSPKRGDRPLDPHTALRTLNELGFTGTDGRLIDRHGFRTSFVTWGKEQLYERDLIMMAIDHVVLNRSDASYYHGDHLEQRRPIMEEWSKVCTGLGRQAK